MTIYTFYFALAALGGWDECGAPGIAETAAKQYPYVIHAHLAILLARYSKPLKAYKAAINMPPEIPVPVKQGLNLLYDIAGPYKFTRLPSIAKAFPHYHGLFEPSPLTQVYRLEYVIDLLDGNHSGTCTAGLRDLSIIIRNGGRIEPVAMQMVPRIWSIDRRTFTIVIDWIDGNLEEREINRELVDSVEECHNVQEAIHHSLQELASVGFMMH
ncbi:hypothetical protein M422DRAFT_45331 [Sphaerobolus stellatus SS14]|nr:hypothetical protein M422DRAFT_45331 [Sphaerobolus stellatus SS14]